ncbi:hypothetical protein [Autumnicola edwardsiae]|uniref:Uncharacterized protein n=1 Tax=Autumnicola edwardsiae TaxID=3075594 RepID=A0ABU3CVI0_9FLAO|nr:hypothetical protein [Zunongwangia sp. F297]MDT0650326.1 hypothetical protein [Zunongwangia sp. F297]
MKTQFTHFYRRSSYFACLLFISLLLFNCSKDDDNPTPEVPEFEEEFEDGEDLPELEDEDPEIVEPETGGVDNSAATQAVVDDLGGDDGEVSEETEASLNAVGSLSDSYSEEVNQTAESLDEDSVEEILNTEDLEGALGDLEQSLNDLPEEVAALMPQINYTADFNRAVAAALQKSSLNISDSYPMSQAVNGPCADAARDGYDARIETLTSQRDAQLATINSNYTRRVEEAGPRYETRLEKLNEDRSAYRADLKATAVSLITAANQFAANDRAVMAKQIRTLALIFTVKSQSSLKEWFNAANTVLSEKRAEEEATALSLQEEKTEIAETNFNTSKAAADALLNSRLNRCHNQGSGN